MSNLQNVDWKAIFLKEVKQIEDRHKINLLIDEAIIFEIGKMVEDSLGNIGLEHPNVAKIAGQVAFWIRKLKPTSISPNSPNNALYANERIALSVGLAICNMYKDDNSKSDQIHIPPRIFRDWIIGFRYHSHSPHSAMTSFELLMSDI